MFVIICNYEDGESPIPIMKDEDQTMGQQMETFDTQKDAVSFCEQHLLCRNWENIIVNLEDGSAFSIIPDDF